MFTYVNSAQDRMYFNTELRKVALFPLKSHPKLNVVQLTLGRHNEPSHKVDLGLYQISSELLKGLATIDEWAKEQDYVTLDMLRKRLKEFYSSPALMTIPDEAKEDDDDDRTK